MTRQQPFKRADNKMNTHGITTFLVHSKEDNGPQLRELFLQCSFVSIFNTLRPRQNGHHFVDDIFNRIFVNENVIISIKFSLKFVPKGPINNIPALVQIMAWRRPGNKPLSEAVMVSLLTHICVPRPQ